MLLRKHGGLMATVTVTAPDSDQVLKVWRIALTILGAIGIVAGLAVELVAVNYHQVTQAIVTGSSPDTVTTTVTGPSAPPTALITGLVAAGVILLMIAAFFPRITKVVFPWGGELDFGTSAALTGVIATKTSNAAEAERLYKGAAAAIASDAPPPTRLAPRQQIAWNMPSRIDEGTLNQIVDSVRGSST
jgi:hypothetical protein